MDAKQKIFAIANVLLAGMSNSDTVDKGIAIGRAMDFVREYMGEFPEELNYYDLKWEYIRNGSKSSS